VRGRYAAESIDLTLFSVDQPEKIYLLEAPFDRSQVLWVGLPPRSPPYQPHVGRRPPKNVRPPQSTPGFTPASPCLESGVWATEKSSPGVGPPGMSARRLCIATAHLAGAFGCLLAALRPVRVASVGDYSAGVNACCGPSRGEGAASEQVRAAAQVSRAAEGGRRGDGGGRAHSILRRASNGPKKSVPARSAHEAKGIPGSSFFEGLRTYRCHAQFYSQPTPGV
jgi:hypothetical protein